MMVLTILAIILIINQNDAYPHNRQDDAANNLIDDRNYASKQWATKAKLSKKNSDSAFMSRGWAAGGMPFSVLYLNQPVNQQSKLAQESSINPRAKYTDYEDYRQEKLVPDQKQIRYLERKQPVATPVNNPPTKTVRKSYSVIPQLFVSYGWGPLGR